VAIREQSLESASVFEREAARRASPLAVALRFARRKPVGAVAAVFLALILGAAIAAPRLTAYSPILTDTPHKLAPPSSAHIFGTDELGRDTWSRLLYGARVSLVVGYGATALAVALATTIALVSGYFGRAVDVVIQRFVDGFLSVPGLLIILTVVTILPPTVPNLTLVLGLIFGIGESRVVRSAVLKVRAMPYVDAAHSMGAGTARLIIQHVLPNVLYIIIVVASLAVGRIIIVEASVAFLGFGVPPPTPTWGQMLGGSARTYMTRAPWMGLAPGIAISLTVLAFNMLGDALRDVLDPRLRGAGRS
jgi:peptide/nickel transport system permease protein